VVLQKAGSIKAAHVRKSIWEKRGGEGRREEGNQSKKEGTPGGGPPIGGEINSLSKGK